MKDINPSHLDEIIVEIKKMQDKIEEHVEWNFGRAPNETWFDELVQQRNDLLDVVKDQDFSSYRDLIDHLFGA